MLALAIVVAVIGGDRVALRASPSRTAAQQAVLWRGDWLEVRGEQRGWLKVYDHRHERPGWVARPTARVVEVDEPAAPGLRAVVEFLRDAPGSESLGIAYAGLYMKAAPRGGLDAQLLVALGTMAERLARRASTEATDGHAAEQIGVAQSWGIGFVSVDRASGVRTCYDGAAWRQALALSPGKPELAASVLGLTDPACDPEIVGATERRAHDQAALALLERVDPTQIPGPIGNRIRIRRAVLGARLAWSLGRGTDPGAGKVAETAVSAFARVDKAELADDDVADFEAAALAIAASRWAAGPAAAIRKGDPSLEVSAGGPGETCVVVESAPKRCTHGQLWTRSFRVAPDHGAAVLAIEPLPGWLELWMFRRAPGGWTVDVLPPATEGPDLGYVELAGWSNDGRRAVIVREARSDNAIQRTFEVINLDTLAVLQHASRLSGLGPAKAWVTPEWRGRTLALR
jgi:hypothetical protein